MSCRNTRMVFFIEWDREFIDFIKGITLSPSLRGHVVVHIFYPQDIVQALLPKYKPWLYKHPSSKETKEGPWKLLEDYVTNFNFCVDYSLTTDTTQNLTTNHSGEEKQCCYIISKSKDRSEKLANAVGKKVATSVKVERGHEMTLLYFVEFKCDACKIAFKGKKELAHHDSDFHSLLCFNTDCRHHKKEKSFSSETELRQHISNQMKCQFCPGKVFCSKEMLEKHLKNTHKKCPCPCGEYFGNRQTYLDHFFSYYPSPKQISVAANGQEGREAAMKKGNVYFSKNKQERIDTNHEDNNSIRTQSGACSVATERDENERDESRLHDRSKCTAYSAKS